jgi:hypothetical protein
LIDAQEYFICSRWPDKEFSGELMELLPQLATQARGVKILELKVYIKGMLFSIILPLNLH